MALLLQEASKLAQDQLRAGIIEVFAENSVILERMDFLNIRGNAYTYNLEGDLPGVAFRGVNEAFTESTGVINPMTESLKIAGGDLDVDSHIIRTRGEQVRAAHEAMKVKAMARYLNRIMFDGDSIANPREFDGLNARLTGSQNILAGAGGAALTQDMVDDLLRQVPGANALLVGDGGEQLMTKLLRNDSQVNTAVDFFGRQVTTYAGVPILNVGDDENHNEILDFDEDPGDAVFDTTSIYAVRMGSADAEQDLFGLQTEMGMMVRDLGELDSKPALRTRVEWDISIVLASRDCAARLRGITNAVA
jgi:hypothetical protein